MSIDKRIDIIQKILFNFGFAWFYMFICFFFYVADSIIPFTLSFFLLCFHAILSGWYIPDLIRKSKDLKKTKT